MEFSVEKLTNIYTAFLASVNQHGDNVAMQAMQEEVCFKLSYKETSEQVQAIVKKLQQHSVQPGYRIALLGSSNILWVINFLAVISLRATVVALDPGLANNQIINQLKDAEVYLLLTTAEKANELNLTTHLYNKTLLIDENHREINLANKPLYVDAYQANADDKTAMIVFTSGTTGQYKGVELSHSNILYAAIAAIQNSQLTAKDNVLCILPAHHIFGLVCVILTPLLTGATITFAEKIQAEHLLTVMAATKPTILVGVPRIFELFFNKITTAIQAKPRPIRLLIKTLTLIAGFTRKHLNLNLGKLFFKRIHQILGGNLRLFVSGAAALNPILFRHFEAFGLTVIEGYGLTETSAYSTATTLTHRQPGCVGRPMIGVELKLHQQNEQGIGEICLKGPTIMRGYWHDPQATATAIIDGWFHTGDLGYVNNNGNLVINGRIKDIIVLPNGKKVMATLIEEHYKDIPGIEEIAIVGMPAKDKMAEEIHAAIKLSEQIPMGLNASQFKQLILSKVSEKAHSLPEWWAIKQIHFVNDLPKTTTLKIRRKELLKILQDKLLIEANTNKTIIEIADEFKEHNTIANKVIECLLQVIHIEEQSRFININWLTSLHFDLGLDSINKIDLHTILENKFNVSITLQTLAKINTVGELIQLITQILVSPQSAPNVKAISALTTNTYQPDDMEHLKFLQQKPGFLRPIIQNFISVIYQCYFKLRVTGTENLPKQPFILCSNHTSHLDTITLILASKRHFSDFVILAAKDYFYKTKINAKLINCCLHAIPFARSNELATMQQSMKYIEHCVAANKNLILFPEGTRSITGKIQDFKVGAVLFASRFNLPIIPAYIQGAYQALPKGKKLPKRGTLSVYFGKPVIVKELEDLDPQEKYKRYCECTDYIKSIIISLKQKSTDEICEYDISI